MSKAAETWSDDDYALDPNDQRFERKFTTDALAVPDLDTILRVHPSLFRIAYPDRWINNIYLDTPDLNFYRDHTYGCRSRAKYRVRWYGDLYQDKAQPVLEIKRKAGLVGSKIRFPLPEFNSGEKLCNAGIHDLIATAGIDPRIAGRIASMQCVVGNRYRRTYFVTADGGFRMTIDRDLEFFEIPARPGARSEPISEPSIVLELKYPNELNSKVDLITQHLPFRMNRFSKYVLGVEQLAAQGRC